MKSIIISCIMIALLIVSGVMSYNMIYSQAENMKEKIEALEQSIESENWEVALKQYKSIDKEWTKTKDKWSVLIDHFEIDHINIVLAELHSYIKSKEQTDSLSKIHSLEILFAHIPDKESFTLKNIL